MLAIPSKRADTTLVSFLTPAETATLLAAPDRGTWIGRRDHVLLLVAVQTGLRVSELTGVNCGDVALGAGANLRCHGKGRKQRCTPLTRATARILADWLRERDSQPADPLFPARTGGRLSTDAVADLLQEGPTAASGTSPSTRSGSCWMW